MAKKKCKQCGQSFDVPEWRKSLAKYCGYECANLGRTTKKNVKKPRKCAGCGEKYLPTTWNQKWCSRECFQKHSKTGPRSKARTCPVCKKKFQSVRKEAKFCSRKCGAQGKRGRSKKTYKGGGVSDHTCDILWAKVIKKKAGNKCEYCGKTTTLNSHHIFSRSNRATRWCRDNGVCLCVSHHVFGNMSAHKAPIEFVEWLKEKRGEEWYEMLRQKAKTTVRKPNKQQIKTELERELE